MDRKMISHLFWSLEKEKVTETLESDLEKGLQSTEAKSRLDFWGENKFGTTERFSKLKVFLKQFKSPLILILIVAGTATLFLKEWPDATIIFLAIIVNAVLGYYQENKAETALANLRSYIQERTRVIRDGKELELASENVVPGDLIHLVHGSRIPADARLISVNNLRTDESILTGESLPIEKQTEVISEATGVADRRNMVFGGTLVTEGNALALVTATGSHTEIGKIATLVLETDRDFTPIQKAIAKLSWIITVGVSVLVTFIFILGLYRGEGLVEMFLIAIAVAVGSIPEALPVGLTAILAVGVEQLAKRKGIMRNLAAAETLGSTTLIMTDKTGTLTEAKMQLVDILSQEDLLSNTTRGNAEKPLERFSAKHKDILFLASLNTEVLIENPEDQPNDWRINGSHLEGNILRSASLHGIDVFNRKKEGDFKLMLPFNSKDKFSVSEGSLKLETDIAGKKQGEAQVVMGAPDILLSKSKMEKEEYLKLLRRVEELSSEGKRLVGVAVKYGVSKSKKFDLESVQDLTFVGLIVFFDPIREKVPEAIKRIENYGVKVVMATGDLKGTALSVAKNIGWEVKENEVLTGEEVRGMNDEELKESLALVKVFARLTPEDKLRISQLYQKRGEIVAMTGDGVNDAPSLKAVNIGIAVGSGSDVAKDVADLVLLNDSFEIIVSAIEEGKRMLRNIRKVFVYLMSDSLDEVFLIGGSLLAGLPLPLNALQIIWVNFFTGSLPAIAFAFDKETDLKGHSNETEKQILDKEVKFLTIGVGVFTSLLLFILYISLLRMGIEEKLGRTFLFVCFACYTLFIAFSFKNLRRPIFSYNIFENRLLVIGVGLGLLLLLATVYVPFLQKIFDTVALGPIWMSLVLVWVVINVLLVEIAKWLFYKKK